MKTSYFELLRDVEGDFKLVQPFLYPVETVRFWEISIKILYNYLQTTTSFYFQKSVSDRLYYTVILSNWSYNVLYYTIWPHRRVYECSSCLYNETYITQSSSQNNCEIHPTFTNMFTKLLPWQDRCAALPRSWEKIATFLDWHDEWHFIKKSKRKLILHISVQVILYYEEFQQ